MDNYPPGAANDKSAPYNQKEPKLVKCDWYDGTGTDIDSDEADCIRCNGSGEMDMPDPEPDPDSMKGGPDYDN